MLHLKEFKSKKECTNHIKIHTPELAEYDSDKLQNVIFKHHNTYSLNPYGKFLLSKYYEHYIHPFKCTTLKEKMMLNRLFEAPYHYCDKGHELTLFDNEVSFLIKLSGDVSDWIRQETIRLDV